MTKMANFENSRWRTVAFKDILPLYLSRRSSDFDGSLVRPCTFWFQEWLRDKKNQNCVNSKWRTDAISKIFFWQYLHDLLSD